MITRRHRLAGHAVAAVLLAGVAVVATGGGAGAANAAADRPESFGGNAVAASMEFRVDKSPFPFPVVDPFHDWVPYAGTSIDSSGGAEATASSIYPGQGVLGVPALLCEFNAGLCHQVIERLPAYPDYAHAQYPSHQDDSATLSGKPFPGTGVFEVTPNRVEAHADLDRVEATTITGAAGVAGVVTVQSANSHSLQTFHGPTLVLTAESVLKGVDIGGQLHIDEIRSTATARIDGSKVARAKANTVVSGATVAGQPVTIDSTGVHVASLSDNGAVKKTVNSALAKLASQGIDVRSLGTSKSSRPRKVAANTGGVLLVAKRPFDGPDLPKVGGIEDGHYTIIASLGGAGVNAHAAPGVDFGGVQIPDTPVTSGAVPPPPAAGGGALPPSSTQTGTTTDTGGQQPAVAAGGTAKPAALPTDLTNKRLKTLALVLLAYPLLILAAAPFRAPARLPRGG